MIKILNELDIKKLGFEEQKDYFIKIQNYIVQRLSKEDRLFYQKNVQNMDDFPKKIKFILSFLESAEKNDIMKENWAFVKKYFPEKYDNILKEFNEQFNDDQFFFLENKIFKLKKALKSKLESQLLLLQKEIIERFDESKSEDILEDLKKINKIEDKITFLKAKLF